MDVYEEEEMLLLILLLRRRRIRREQKASRKVRVRKILRLRRKKGAFQNLIPIKTCPGKVAKYVFFTGTLVLSGTEKSGEGYKARASPDKCTKDRLYVCMYVCMYACMHVCMYA